MRKKNYDVTKLMLVKTFAKKFVKKNGLVGVSRQYIETLLDKKKNKGFIAVDIDGVKFIHVTDPEIIEKPSSEQVKQVIANPPTSKAEKQKVNELLKNEDVAQELIKISEQLATKESVGKKETPSKNQLSMF